MGGSSEMAMRERGDATRVQIPPARQRAAWRRWRVCSDAAGWPAPTWHLCHVTPRLSSSLTGLEITSAPCEWGELRTNYGPRRSNSAHINGQPWTPAINGSRSTRLAARSGGQGVASSNLASPTDTSPCHRYLHRRGRTELACHVLLINKRDTGNRTSESEGGFSHGRTSLQCRPLAGSRNLLMNTAGNTVPVTDPSPRSGQFAWVSSSSIRSVSMMSGCLG